MLKSKKPINEDTRLKELQSYGVENIIDKEDFDFLTKIAAKICGTNMAFVSLVFEEKQIFLSKHGLEVSETPRDISFCAHALLKPNDFFIVNDASEDDNFKDNPLVTGSPFIKFYAGKPLVTENGSPIGALCVVDKNPKELSLEEKNLLDSLSKQVMKLLELRKKQRETEAINKRLQKNNTILELTQEASNIGAWELDIETDTVYWSEKVYEIHEIEKDFEQNKSKALDFYHPEDRQNVVDALDKAINKGQDFDIINRLLTAKGNEKWVRSTGRKFENKIVGSFQDITLIKKKELKYKAIFNSAFTFLGFIDPNGILLEVNQSSLDLSNLQAEDILGKYLWDCYWWQISEEAKERVKEKFYVALKGKSVFYEDIVLATNEKPVNVLISLKPIFDENGDIDFILAEGCNIQDVADVRKRFKLAIEGANIATWEYNIQTGETSYNETWASMLGYTLDEFKKSSIETWKNLVHPEDLIKSNKSFEQYIKNDDLYYERENRMRHKDGSWVWVLDRGRIFEWTEDGKPLKMYGIHQNITNLKKNQEALRLSEETFRGNFENAAIGMALIDTLGKLNKVNSKLGEMLGYSKEELLKIKLKNVTHPEDFKNDTESLKKVISKEISNYKTEKRYFKKNGDIVHAIVAISAVRDKSGEVLYFVAQLVDITQIKRVESEIKSLLHITKDQNDRLMNFAHIVSHNLRSHSSGIIGLLEVIEKEEPLFKNNEFLRMVHVGASNLHQTVEDLSNIISINFSKPDLKNVDIQKIVEKSIQSLSKKILDADISVTNNITEETKIWGVPHYLESITLNMITNAIKYKSEDRKSYLKIYSEVNHNHVYLYFEDNGLGINLEKHGDRIFQMYRTFHKHDNARGIGLFISKNQVESMNGEISVDSKVDVGTTFKIKLPHEKN
jgi:PAS domain S-box-containing protein